MTGAQANWLSAQRANGYRPLGNAPSGFYFSKVGMLFPDGSFELKQSRNWRYSRIEAGGFEVGVLAEVAAAHQEQKPFP